MFRVISEFLVKFLEQEVCRLNWDVGFVTSTMQEIGVQLPRLLEVYDQLFKTRVQIKSHVSSMCSFFSFVKAFMMRTKLSHLIHQPSSLPFYLQDPCWQRLKKPLHLVECIHVLLSGYVDDPSRVPTYDR